MTAAHPVPLPTKPMLLGASADGRTNRWRITCPACQTRFEPQTTMFNEQGLECPKPRCQAQLLANYRTEEVTMQARPGPRTHQARPAAIPALDPAQVMPCMPVCRRPAGRICCVAEVSPDRSKVLIQDSGKRFWVGMASLVKNWY